MDKKGIILALIASCSLFSKLSGKKVNILIEDSLASKKQYECGRKLTLSCQFENNSNAIVWKNEKDITAISKCLKANCTLNPIYVGKYTISTDMARGFFNLTITKVTKHDNGRKLVCTDGSSSDSKIIKVRDYEPLIIEDTKTGIISAISGCIPKHRKVSLKWIKINISTITYIQIIHYQLTGQMDINQVEKCAIRNNGEQDIIPKIQHAKTTNCSKDSECGNDHQIQYSEVVLAKANENGNFYLKVVAYYGNEVKESHITVQKYTIDDQEEAKNNAPIRYAIVVAVVLVLLVILLAAAVYCFKLFFKNRMQEACQLVVL